MTDPKAPKTTGGVLDGVRILDLTRLLPGSFATSLLADMGAEVIKVEQPGTGDHMRWDEPKIGAESAHSWVTDRNKNSISMDLKDPEAVSRFLELAGTAQVIFESFRPGVVDRLGIGYDAVSAVNPAIVFCSMSGYGQDGPLSQAAGHDINYLGRAGVLSVTGPEDGVPVVPGVQVADLGGGASMAVAGILAALYRAATTGAGDHVDVSMTDGAFSLLSIHMGDHFASGEVPRGSSMPYSGLYPSYRVYECADGRHLTVGAADPRFFARLCEVMGLEDRVGDRLNPDAVEDWKGFFLQRSRDEWLELFEGHDVSVGPVNDLAEASEDAQLRSRHMVVDLEHPTEGSFRQVGTPIKFRNHPTSISSPAPGLGRDTGRYLREIGTDEQVIEDLIRTQEDAAAGMA